MAGAPALYTHLCTSALSAELLGRLQFSQTVPTPQEPIYRPSDEILDISVNKTKEDLSRPPFPSVYQREVLKRQLTFSLAFLIFSILLPTSLSVSFFVFCSHFLTSPSSFFSWPLPLHPPTFFPLFSSPVFSSLLSHLSSLCH